MMRKLPKKTGVLLLLLGVFMLGSNAWALPVEPGESAMLGGTTLADRPELAGTAIVDELIPFTGMDAFGTEYFSGTIQARIVREDSSGTLDFYYRLFNDINSEDGITRLSATDFTGWSTDVDFRIDSLGFTNPDRASRQLSGATVSFDFSDSVLPGDESRFFFIKTNATSYTAGSVILIDGGAAVIRAYAPVPEPGLLILLGCGLASLVFVRMRSE